MRTQKWLLFGGSILLAAAISSLILSDPPRATAAGSCPSGSACVSDITVNDFAQGQFYLTGLRNTFDGKVQLLPFGLTSDWTPDPDHLPDNRAELAAVMYKDTIYAIGGFDADTSNIFPHKEIFTAKTFITGPIASAWTNPISLPVGLGSMPAVISTTQTGAYLYVLGGQTNSFLFEAGYTSTIFYHALDLNGAFTGSWLTASMPITYYAVDATGLVYHQAVVHNGFLYIIGGSDGTFDHSEIFHASLNSSTGALGTWIQDPSLPTARSSFAAAVFANGNGTDYLYVMGGKSNSSNGNAEVYVATFNPNGSLNGFSNGSFPLLYGGSYAHGGVQGNGELYVTGGAIGAEGIVTTVVESTVISPTGDFPFNWNPTNPLPQPRKYHATVINSGGEVYVIGGYSGSGGDTAKNTVYHGSTTGVGDSYVSSGNYTSRILDLGGQHPLTSLIATTTLSQTVLPMTLTLQYRFATSLSSILTTNWTPLGNAQNGINHQTTFPLGGTTAGFVQYQAFFTTTTPYNLSPMINEIDIAYPSLPDFSLPGLSAPPNPNTLTAEAITITVYRKPTGQSPIRVLAAPSNSPSKKPTGRFAPPPLPSSLRNTQAPLSANSVYYFWVGFYNNPAIAPTNPYSVTGTMNCVDGSHGVSGSAPFIYLQDLNLSNPYTYWATCNVPANTPSFYAQIDLCNTDSGGPYYDPNCFPYGLILEADESGSSPNYGDNIFGPVTAGSTGGVSGGGLVNFFPYIKR